MTRLFIASEGNRDAMADAFRRELPGFDILTDSADFGAGPVPYIVVGKPAPGVIAAVPGLEVVLSLNAGVEHLLASGEVPDTVPIVRMVDPAMTEGMSDWVLAQVLSWHRNLDLYRGDQATRNWNPRAERLSRDRVVSVLGAGTLGARVAELLVAVGFVTRVWSRSGRDIAGAAAFSGGDGLVRAVTGADVVVNLLPLTEATRDVLNRDVFERMARGGFLVNAARGAHLVEADLIAALRSGRLSAAALDVFRTEPLPPDDPLWRQHGVLITPHVAAPTQDGSAIGVMAENVRRHQRGEPMSDVVDRGLGY